MSIKILSGGLKNETQKDLQGESSLMRNLARTPVTIAKLGGIPGNIAQTLTGKPEINLSPIGNIKVKKSSTGEEVRPARKIELPTSETIEKKAEELTGVRKGYFAPQSKAEEFLDMLVQDIPFLALTGITGGITALPSAIKKTIGATSGIFAAKEAGFGPIGEIVGSIYGAKTPDKISSIIKNLTKKSPEKAAKNLLTHMQEAASKSYNRSNEILKNVRGNATELKPKLEATVEELSFIPNKENLKAARDINYALEDIYDNKMDINIAKKFAQRFKRMGYTKNLPPDISSAYKTAGNTIRDWIYGLEPEFQEGISLYKRADQLHTLNKAQKKLEHLINSNSSLKSIFESGFLKNAFGIALKKGGTIPASRLKRFWREPEAQEYLREVFNSIDYGADKEAIAALTKLGNYAQSYDRKKELPSKGNFKIISGGLK